MTARRPGRARAAAVAAVVVLAAGTVIAVGAVAALREAGRLFDVIDFDEEDNDDSY